MATVRILSIIISLLTGATCFCQPGIDSVVGKINPQKWKTLIEKKAGKLESRLTAKSERALHRLQKQEEKIYRRMLHTGDSLQARQALKDIKSKYQSLQDKIKNPSGSRGGNQYLAKLDTLSGVLKFINQNGAGANIDAALAKTQSLQDKFRQAEEIKKFMRERRLQLKEQLEKLGWAKQLKKFNKEYYYYGEQVREYKELLNDSKKAERKAIALLGKTKFFRDFMHRNSQLASLFRLPGDPNDPGAQAGLAGLQTLSQVNALIQQQIAAGGPGAQAQFRQNLQSAQARVLQLKNEMRHIGGSSNDIIPEGFKPNNQKTKGFWKRLELGTNFQTQKATNFFPVTTDMGLSAGYKLNDKSIIGIGASYKMGWGRGFNNIRISSEGAGLRSFIDWKIKKSLWLSGGYEMNYKTAFKNFEQLKGFDNWLQSGMLGLSKTIAIKNRFFKKTKLQLLWDFLSYEQVPKTQPVIFRAGYTF